MTKDTTTPGPVVGLAVARGGSRAVPRKNLRLVAGRPLIEHTFASAKKSRLLDRIILSTDDEEIAAVARRCGVEVPFSRPAALASDTATALEVGLHALDWLASHEGCTPSLIVLLQPTSPLREACDIDSCIEKVIETGAPAAVSVVEAHAHPFLMKTIDSHGCLVPVCQSGLSQSRRQDLPGVFALNGAIYAVRPSALRDSRSWCPPGAVPYVMPDERSIDIDTEWDLKLAELILLSRKT